MNPTTDLRATARPVSSGMCSCVTAPKAYVRNCSRKAAWIVLGRRYCSQHLPETVTKVHGEPGDFVSLTYVVTKKVG
jgi:hypothetical protein